MRSLISHVLTCSTASRSRVRFAALAVLAALALALPAAARAADHDACVAAHEHAQVDRLEGHYIAARAALLACAQRECPKLLSSECTGWLSELDTVLPTVVFAAEGEAQRDLLDVRILLNGQPITNYVEGRALPLDPGVYKLRFEAPGYRPVEQTLSVRDGEKNRLVRASMQPVTSEPSGLQTGAASALQTGPRQPTQSEPVDLRARRLWLAAYPLTAATVLSFAVALGAGVRGHAMQKHCNDDACSERYAEHGKALYRTVNASSIAGGVLLVAAAGTLWSALRRDARSGSDSSARAPSKLGIGGFADSQSATLTAWGRW